MDKEEAIKICRKIIQQNSETVKQTRKNNDINAMQLTANCDTESKAIATLLQAVENSIPTQVVEEKIQEYKNVIDECREDEEHCGEIPIYEHDIKVLQELLQEKGEK